MASVRFHIDIPMLIHLKFPWYLCFVCSLSIMIGLLSNAAIHQLKNGGSRCTLLMGLTRQFVLRVIAMSGTMTISWLKQMNISRNTCRILFVIIIPYSINAPETDLHYNKDDCVNSYLVWLGHTSGISIPLIIRWIYETALRITEQTILQVKVWSGHMPLVRFHWWYCCLH